MMIEIRNVYKVFGPSPESALPLLREGRGKDDILNDTGHTVGLNDVTLSAEAGETFVVMGLSGSGKSTLIRHLNRLIDPTAGEVIVDGTDVMGLSEAELIEFRRHKASMVFQRFGLFPHRTVLSNASYGLRVQGLDRQSRRDKARRWIDLVGLSGYEDMYPSELSGGMQQRVGLARALATDADILLMDEPFSALDPLIRREMQDLLIELQNKLHKTIVFITHDLDEALRLGDRIAILKDGAVVQFGTPEEILLHPADDYVEAFVKDVNRGRILTAASVMIQPGAVASGDEKASVALARCRDGDHDYAYVVDEDKRLRGVITANDIEASVRANGDRLNGGVQEVPTVKPDTVIEDLFALSCDCTWPLAVADAGGALIGVIPRKNLLRALADASSSA
ncbi:MAG: glycine betaine/L-proline ABC transporter ATP-binding protein [Rhodospirillales bacterium]|jgi:glycine betaine/proline transport system ATP-binding protein|nr:glycine betaine/L-proline ABC transporter ATP-binding protein [Rhodospirillales bacterium]